MLFWLLGRQEWLCWYYKSKMGLRQAVAPPYLTVFHTRRNVVRRKALEILWVFLIEQAKQGQDGSAAAHNDSWSAVRVRRIFLNFPTFSPIRMNSMTCWNVYSNLNGSIKMRAQETWPLQWSANPPTDQLSLTCSLKANRQVRAPRGNVLTIYQSGISCGEVSPTAIMAWLRGILSCCYLKDHPVPSRPNDVLCNGDFQPMLCCSSSQ